MAKKEQAPQVASFEFGQSKADIAFRTDPFARALLLGAVMKKRETRDDTQGAPLSATPRERQDLAALRTLSEIVRYNHGYRDYTVEAKTEAMEVFERLARERWGDARAGEARTLVFKAMGDSQESRGRRGSFLGSFRGPDSEALGGIKLVEKLRAQEIQRLALMSIPDESLERELSSGRQFFCEDCGWSVEALDQMRADPQLALAVCRLLFGGATELGLVNQGHHCNPIELLSQLAIDDEEGHEDGEPTVLPKGHPLLSFTHELSYGADVARARQLGTVLGSALGAPRWGAQAAQALKGLSGSEKAWEAMPAWGEALVLGPNAVNRWDGKRKSGVSSRGEPARQALAQWVDILQWRSPLRELNDAPGPRFAQALLGEARARQEKMPEVLACAMSILAREPDLSIDIASAMASRVAEGFGAAQGVELEDLFPELPQAIEQENERRQEKQGRVDPMKWATGAKWEDPMAPVALAASKALGVKASGEMALVGEAKKALLDRGLSAGGWRAMAASEEVAAAFAKALKSMQASVPKAAPVRRGAKRAAMEVMKQADAAGSAFSSKIKAIDDQEARGAPAEALGKAMSACAMHGLGAPEQARLLNFLAACPVAAQIVAGRLPQIPRETMASACQLKIDEADVVGALKMEVDAIVATGPAWARALSDRLEREIKKKIKQGAQLSEAQQMASSELSQMMDDLLDCAREQPLGFWAGLDKKDPLGSASRAHEAWSRDQRERQAQSDPNFRMSWPKEAGVMKSGRVEAVELSSGADLFDEGKAMSHCVASYASNCAQGQSRVFSIRIGGARQTTLELNPTGGRDEFDATKVSARKKITGWSIGQNKGKHNSTNISEEIKVACQEFAREYEKAFKANTERMELEAQKERDKNVDPPALGKKKARTRGAML